MKPDAITWLLSERILKATLSMSSAPFSSVHFTAKIKDCPSPVVMVSGTDKFDSTGAKFSGVTGFSLSQDMSKTIIRAIEKNNFMCVKIGGPRLNLKAES